MSLLCNYINEWYYGIHPSLFIFISISICCLPCTQVCVCLSLTLGNGHNIHRYVFGRHPGSADAFHRMRRLHVAAWRWRHGVPAVSSSPASPPLPPQLKAPLPSSKAPHLTATSVTTTSATVRQQISPLPLVYLFVVCASVLDWFMLLHAARWLLWFRF